MPHCDRPTVSGLSETSDNLQSLDRISGVRADGSRETLHDSLPVHQAADNFMNLMDSKEFTVCNVERDLQGPTAGSRPTVNLSEDERKALLDIGNRIPGVMVAPGIIAHLMLKGLICINVAQQPEFTARGQKVYDELVTL